MTANARSARITRLVWAAFALWLLALLGFAAAFGGFSHTDHPVALLGAQGIARAMGFNALGFVVPGLLVAAAALELRGVLDRRGWPARIGAHLLLLSALGFAAQGLLPLDPGDLDAPSSRLHATVWSLWWIAFLPGIALLAIRSRGLLISGLGALALAAVAAVVLPPGLAQRVAMSLWFLASAGAGHLLARDMRPQPVPGAAA